MQAHIQNEIYTIRERDMQIFDKRKIRLVTFVPETESERLTHARQCKRTIDRARSRASGGTVE